MFFLVRGWGAENTEKKKKTDRRKTLKEGKKKEEYQESEHLWFSMNIFGFTFYIKNHILLESITESQNHILFTLFMRCRIFGTQ